MITTGGNSPDGLPVPIGGISFRPAEQREYGVVGALAIMHRRAWLDSYEKFVGRQYLSENTENRFNAFDFQREHQRLIEEDGYTIWLAEADDKPVGLAIFGPDPDNHGQGKIDSLYVDTPWQGKGVGKGLFSEVIDRLKFPVVVLDCAEQNHDGRNFWVRRGFKAVGPGKLYEIPDYGRMPTLRYERHSANPEHAHEARTDAGPRTRP